MDRNAGDMGVPARSILAFAGSLPRVEARRILFFFNQRVRKSEYRAQVVGIQLRVIFKNLRFRPTRRL